MQTDIVLLLAIWSKTTMIIRLAKACENKIQCESKIIVSGFIYHDLI